MLLASLKLDEGLIVELLATSSNVVARRAREILRENMPAGCDLNSLQQYILSSRQSYTMQGLRLRSEQDKSNKIDIKHFYQKFPGFRQALIETKNSLLIVCDRNDPEVKFEVKHELMCVIVGNWNDYRCIH